MTIEEIHVDFKLKYDKLDSNASPGFITPHIDWVLNSAQNRVLKQRITGNNPLQVGFEQHQKRVEDLGSLVVRNQSFIPAQISASQYRIDYKDVYTTKPIFYLLRLEADLLKGSCSKTSNTGQQVQHDDLNRILTDPFSKPNFDYGDFVYLIGQDPNASSTEGRSIYLYTDNFAVSSVRLDYIKKPNRMSLGGYNYPAPRIGGGFIAAVKTECELPEHMHEEMVNEAVKMMAEIVESPNYATKINELTTQE